MTTRPTPDAGQGQRPASARLLGLLDAVGARYRLLPHPPEGNTARASELRGHPLSAAAKCMIVTVPDALPAARQVLAVIPGDRRVALPRVAAQCGARRAKLADRALAERLGGCASGSIIPFSFHHELTVLADPALLDEPVLYFNAARLDLSVALATEDYRALADPKIVPIAE
ncbi:YbaK/prolyl-tRNA synthetase associated domain-containing protein [Streptomyces yunnanensis]|uniref:YbaK/prolyl-tRNA synthetase associated domain-containing protein n=1 Tax=Streptomyces yunnanensis TaxID=156453 RepID=A0ABY8A8E9_9ACTN|nr:YbaK/EbsC family protein [Streptomyces yunnanensis]WEB40001.1 YbaK/prolyl-tRNA synthetase associated domain-containing protein [Streptomyces yunnanensis]